MTEAALAHPSPDSRRLYGQPPPLGDGNTVAQQVVERAIKMIKDQTVIAVDGSTIALRADTICLHGDRPGAGERVRSVRRALELAGVLVRSPSRST